MKMVSTSLLVISLILSAYSKVKPPSIEQQTAYAILKTKCNVCHQTKNPKKVFTIDNMNGFASKINRQVFVFKRMPKGNDIKLSDQEKRDLKNWIKLLNK